MSWYNKAKAELLKGDLDLDADTLRVMLVDSTYTFDADDDFVDEGGGSDPTDAEITSVTNYSRQTLANASITEDDGNDVAYLDADDTTWASLGNGTNATVAAAILFKQGPTNDTDAVLIAYFDVTDFTTSGTDYRIKWSTSGILELS